MDDWTVATYTELCAYWNLYQREDLKNPATIAAIEKEMRVRERDPKFGKTIH